MEVPGLGRIELVPAQPGLAQSTVLAKEARAALKEGLFGLGVGDVLRARELRAAREEAERTAETLRRRIKQLAPSGIDELAVRAANLVQERARMEGLLALSIEAQRELDGIRAALSKHSIDAEVIQTLRTADREVEVARESRGAMGTELVVRALAEIAVRVGKEESSVTLLPGQTISQQIARPTTVFLGNTAEVILTPRGEDLARATARLENAERALSSALRVHSVESLEHAETRATARAELAQKKSALEKRLAELAPDGIDKLRADVERMGSESTVIETHVASAREALTRQAQLGVELETNPVSAQKFARILDLEKAVIKCEITVNEKSARLRGLSGMLVGREIIVTEPMPIEDPSNGAGWTVTPGESSEWATLGQTERALNGAFQRANVLDLGAARERWAAGRDLAGKRERLVEKLKLVAPDGLDALRGRQRALEAATALELPGADDGSSTEELQQRIDVLAADLLPLEATQASAKERARSLENDKNVCVHEVSELRGRWMEQKTQYERLIGELAASRKEASDSELRANLDKA
ncbi:MAG TPA: hypothetical protein PK156_51335, partial [Polyangium sp.]|nr:hypothetical protein [Polyangium sp.]